MTANDVPTDPSVLNTTALSYIPAIDCIELVADIDGICAVPEMEGELEVLPK